MTAHRIPLSELEPGIPFEQRHIGPDHEARAKMLAHVGYGSLDELTAAAVPDVIKNADSLDLPGARTEAEVLAELRSLADRNQVLDSMAEAGEITQDEAKTAKATPLHVVPSRGRIDVSDAPYFADYVQNQLGDMVAGQGAAEHLRIYTTIDMDLQRAAYAAAGVWLARACAA